MSEIFFILSIINPLTPNDLYISRTTPLTSKRCILYIYSTNVGTEYFKHALYSPFFSLQNAVCFIMLTCLVPVLFTFNIQGVLKLKKNNSGAKGLITTTGMKFSPRHWVSAFNHFHSIFTVSITSMSATVSFSIILPCVVTHTFLQGNTFDNEFLWHLFWRYVMIADKEDYLSTDSGCIMEW